MLEIAAYFALFLSIGAIFVFANLLVGRLVRPHNPHPEKNEVYECGEPTVGSSYVQFDLRFYVVALLFIIFGVEVAFFFPWAVVAGKANLLRDESLPIAVVADSGDVALTRPAAGLLREIGLRDLSLPAVDASTVDASVRAKAVENEVRRSATSLAWIAAADIALFFAVLAVGFAYVWKRGDLDWVRAAPRRFAGATPEDRGPRPLDSDDPQPIVAHAGEFAGRT
ncbi:MAG TPA: NADH-quinone oxidoreductase subunit A [Pirellulaceae bacterium]|jgi:NADH-quinone oxidoreductase subunit A|nr:NADH-quinone oxidoreductase subunit A [Pirellulaceae bacterium]